MEHACASPNLPGQEPVENAGVGMDLDIIWLWGELELYLPIRMRSHHACIQTSQGHADKHHHLGHTDHNDQVDPEMPQCHRLRTCSDFCLGCTWMQCVSESKRDESRGRSL